MAIVKSNWSQLNATSLNPQLFPWPQFLPEWLTFSFACRKVVFRERLNLLARPKHYGAWASPWGTYQGSTTSVDRLTWFRVVWSQSIPETVYIQVFRGEAYVLEGRRDTEWDNPFFYPLTNTHVLSKCHFVQSQYICIWKGLWIIFLNILLMNILYFWLHVLN